MSKRGRQHAQRRSLPKPGDVVLVYYPAQRTWLLVEIEHDQIRTVREYRINRSARNAIVGDVLNGMAPGTLLHVYSDTEPADGVHADAVMRKS